MAEKPETSVASRKAALATLRAVLCDGQSLSALGHLTESLPPRDAALARLLSYGSLRYYYPLKALLKKLVQKPLKAKDFDIELVLILALYQLLHTRVPDYAVVDVAVKQVPKRKAWARKLVNGVLRNFLRNKDSLLAEPQDEEGQYAHPQWIIDQLKQDWPDDWQAILNANNQQPPMTLRVNQQKISTDDYLAKLTEAGVSAEKLQLPSALVLQEAADVEQLPGYLEGWFSVQDAGAQFAAPLLAPQPGERVLDACAAPGGKTAHLLELQPSLQLTALDISAKRLQRVLENCERLGLNAEVLEADASEPDAWWQGELYDRILLDVPCSATGVIRRHPDIKHLRREEDIEALVSTQRTILSRSWSLLKPGGSLLYATCSVFHRENHQQIEWFLSEQADAELQDISDWVTGYNAKENLKRQAAGLQLLPLKPLNDGFYYALLRKKRAEPR